MCAPCAGDTHGKARSGTPRRGSNDGCIGNGASIGSRPALPARDRVVVAARREVESAKTVPA